MNEEACTWSNDARRTKAFSLFCFMRRKSSFYNYPLYAESYSHQTTVSFSTPVLSHVLDCSSDKPQKFTANLITMAAT